MVSEERDFSEVTDHSNVIQDTPEDIQVFHFKRATSSIRMRIRRCLSLSDYLVHVLRLVSAQGGSRTFCAVPHTCSGQTRQD